jgi:poly-gamma-glutamate synthesis protein (capsule biosynthesis protein)
MNRSYLALLVFCIISNLVNSQVDSLTPILNADSSKIENDLSISDTNTNGNLSIVFAGDIMGHDTQIIGAWDDSIKSYNYEPTFRYISDYISAADIAVGNLEVTLAGKPFKGYPQFSSPDELAAEAKRAGFDVMVMANNHCLDRGKKGMIRTHKILDSLGFLYTGTFLHDSIREKYYPLIIEKNNIRLALLNYTYGTNGLKVDKPLIVNRLDTALIHADLDKAIRANPDFTIVITHWGVEYEQQENSKQREMADFMFRYGADAIIGSHPHVIQPVKYNTENDSIIKEPVFYSMGNFVSNQRAQHKDGGIMAEIHLSKRDSAITIDSLAWLPYWVYRKDKNKKSTFYVLPVSKYESDTTIVDFLSSDIYRFNRFVENTRKHLSKSPVPESSFYLRPGETMLIHENKQRADSLASP